MGFGVSGLLVLLVAGRVIVKGMWVAEYVFGLVVWLGGWLCKMGGIVVCGGCKSCCVVGWAGV